MADRVEANLPRSRAEQAARPARSGWRPARRSWPGTPGRRRTASTRWPGPTPTRSASSTPQRDPLRQRRPQPPPGAAIAAGPCARRRAQRARRRLPEERDRGGGGGPGGGRHLDHGATTLAGLSFNGLDGIAPTCRGLLLRRAEGLRLRGGLHPGQGVRPGALAGQRRRRRPALRALLRRRRHRPRERRRRRAGLAHHHALERARRSPGPAARPWPMPRSTAA